MLYRSVNTDEFPTTKSKKGVMNFAFILGCRCGSFIFFLHDFPTVGVGENNVSTNAVKP